MPENAEAEVRTLYNAMIDAWNRRDAAAYAALVAEDGHVVGFDGSMLDGRPQIENTLGDIFAHHQTPPYVSLVREVRFLTPDVAILRAAAGMTPKGEIDPSLNAVQTLVAVMKDSRWQVVLLQNTPAAFHGRPEEVQNMTEELQAVAGHGSE